MTVPVRRTFAEFSPPHEIRPIAPCVQVWLSPAQRTMPGWLSPVSGPTMCMMPYRGSDWPKALVKPRSRISSASSSYGCQPHPSDGSSYRSGEVETVWSGTL